jgi:hypothetical protein
MPQGTLEGIGFVGNVILTGMLPSFLKTGLRRQYCPVGQRYDAILESELIMPSGTICCRHLHMFPFFSSGRNERIIESGF